LHFMQPLFLCSFDSETGSAGQQGAEIFFPIGTHFLPTFLDCEKISDRFCCREIDTLGIWQISAREIDAPIPSRVHSLFRKEIMAYWLMKSEPSEVSIDDLIAAPDKTAAWTGVRNYQARNFMRDAMRVGDGVLFYHSSCAAPGVAGLAEVASIPYPDETQFDPENKYFDAKASHENPRWMLVDVRAVRKTRLIPLAELRAHPELENMLILKRGNRLSITPLAPDEWRFIVNILIRKQ
jgi:predicted RNA-binding protein with PUA-like domain